MIIEPERSGKIVWMFASRLESREQHGTSGRGDMMHMA